jgi:hypothetical protein
MSARVRAAGVLTAALLAVAAGSLAPRGGLRAQTQPAAASPAEAFRRAGDLIRSGDALRGLAMYRLLAASGFESGSLYWNWAQAASARGELGEAVWAILRGREVEPGDRALSRELERLREAANLDPAELAPEPLAALGRLARRFDLGWAALVLAALSLAAHVVAHLRPAKVWPARAAWALGALAVIAAIAPVGAAMARPTGVVVRRGAPLLDAASGAARSIGALRQGEVVPVLERSAEYLRVEDSAGARGWAHRDDVWPLDRRPEP